MFFGFTCHCSYGMCERAFTETFCHLSRNRVGMLFPEVFCVDVCELRGVRPDVTRSPRACVRVNRFDQNPPTFLSSVADMHAELSLACATHVINVSRTRHCERHRGFQDICRRMVSTSAGPLSSGQSGPRGLGGALEVRTVIVLSRT